jgi:hypothetical protein
MDSFHHACGQAIIFSQLFTARGGGRLAFQTCKELPVKSRADKAKEKMGSLFAVPSGGTSPSLGGGVVQNFLRRSRDR